MKEKKSFKFIFTFLFFLSWFIPLASVNASLGAPNIIYPKSSDSPVWAGKIEFRWSNTDANYYKYHINLPTGESREGMTNFIFQEIYDLSLGYHSWVVSSCNDSQGMNCGNWSNSEGLTVESAPSKLLKGLVPCGRKYDNPETSIMESKPCQFTDIFVLFKYMLDFILWRAGLIVLALLVLTAGAITYFNAGSPDLNIKMKSLLKSTITGYLIILLAWLAVNAILTVLGYEVAVFGRWWELKF